MLSRLSRGANYFSRQRALLYFGAVLGGTSTCVWNMPTPNQDLATVLSSIDARLSRLEYSTAKSEVQVLDALHRINPNTTKLLNAPIPGQVTSKHINPTETKVIRIVLTGGPCGGKSSAMRRLAEVATAKGYDVYVAPECATLLFNSGVKWHPESQSFVDAFQASNVALQLQLERTMTSIAGATNRPSIIVWDRGLLDSKGFTDDAGWKRVLATVNKNDARAEISDEYFLKRYDAVIHMETAAKGAEKYYKWGDTRDDLGHKVFRREDPAMARKSDEDMQRVWKSHPRHIVVDNSTGFEAKVQRVANAVLSIAEEIQPQKH